MQHTKASLEESLQEKWEGKVIHDVCLCIDRQLVS